MQNLGQLAFTICVPIPDPVEPTGARLQLAPLAGDQVAEQMEVRALEKGEAASAVSTTCAGASDSGKTPRQAT
jgi:hypothetical protein